jgi:hypothetical protein
MKKCKCDKYFVNKYNMHDQNCEALKTNKSLVDELYEWSDLNLSESADLTRLDCEKIIEYLDAKKVK